MQHRTDEELVMLIRAGDTSAFEILVMRYQKQIFALAYRLGGDYDEANDMAQEAFLRIYRELPRYDASRRFFPWMYKVAYNTCLNVLHKRPREAANLDQMGDTAAPDAAAHSPTAAYAETERAEVIHRALQSLPEQYRIPLTLKYLGGLSYQEISEQMDLPVSTIETRLFRGRNMLRSALAEYMDIPAEKHR